LLWQPQTGIKTKTPRPPHLLIANRKEAAIMAASSFSVYRSIDLDDGAKNLFAPESS
jgi:hypothetical protein